MSEQGEEIKGSILDKVPSWWPLLIPITILIVYLPVIGFEFIALDDHLYVVENPYLKKGLTKEGVIWAFTTFWTTNWHPLTWISLMVDYELYGINPSGYHLTNVLLHLINTLLLFQLLKNMTGKKARSALVAALFALHPLNIESVVWISERKNLLSALFWFLTLFAYVNYTREGKWNWYILAVVLFVLGLMAKPMAVTIPAVMLMVDFWPLGRFSLPLTNPNGSRFHSNLRRLLWEKVPLLILSLGSAIVTYWAAAQGGALKSLSKFPFWDRMANVVFSYWRYLEKTIRPYDLAIFYPYESNIPLWKILSAIFLLLFLCWCAIKNIRSKPYYFTGWLWFIVSLVPVIGIIQVGYQSMANRYAYIPLVGIFFAAVWGSGDILATRVSLRARIVIAITLVFLLAVFTGLELENWRNSETAFTRALEVTKGNHIAHMGMGNLWFGRGNLIQASRHYEEAIILRPDYAEAHNNLALVFMKKGMLKEAINELQVAVQADSCFAEAYNNLGTALAIQGEYNQAVINFQKALEIRPTYKEAKENLSRLKNHLQKIEKKRRTS